MKPKNEITIKLTAKKRDLIAKLLYIIDRVMIYDEIDGVWRADYESIIIELTGEEMVNLQEVATQI